MKRKFSRSLIFCAFAVALWLFWQFWRDHRYDPEIKAAAKEYDVPAPLVKAVVWQESRFHSHARGTKGEIGLMQIREAATMEWATAEGIRGFQHEFIYDPALNTRVGAWYLSKLLKRYRSTDNPLPYALADYNAGRGNVLKWNRGEASTNSARFMEAMTFPTTRAYIQHVMERYEIYKKGL